MPTPRVIVLMGLRGSGKTTVARLLAPVLRASAIDLDELTAERLGFATAGEAFSARGEAEFRRAESAALRAVLHSAEGSRDPGLATPRTSISGAGQEARAEAAEAQAGRVIVALGGGTPTAPGAGDLLVQARASGLARVIYLRAPAFLLRGRMLLDDIDTRPALTSRGVLNEVDEVLAARDPYYRSIADVVIETGGLSLGGVGEAVRRAAG